MGEPLPGAVAVGRMKAKEDRVMPLRDHFRPPIESLLP